MASSPSSMSGRRNRPGCMSGIAHLFDFNQALAGRKLLTDKKYGAGLEPLRNTSNDNVEQFNSKANSRGQSELGKSASVSRRSVEVPMKALIAEEISQELARAAAEPKNRAPSVVARLMGLDAMPSDRSQQSIQSGELESFVQKVPSDRLQHGKRPAHISSRGYKSAGPPTRSVSDLSSSRRSSWEEHMSTFGSLSSQSHSHEQDSRIVIDPWKDWKSEGSARMQALDDLDLQLAAKQMLIKKKLSEAKIGLLSNHSGLQERLYESKEFMDAIDFLQANKDFFATFLEEPDSLFAKDLRNNEEKLSPRKMEEPGKHTKRHSFGALENGVTAQNWRKEPPDLQKSPHKRSAMNRRVDERISGDGAYPQAFSVTTQNKHMKSTRNSVSSNGECQQAPTRIVVLKPGPGKVRNLMSLSQNSPRSPRECFDAMEVIKESSMDVLQDLKRKLQQEDSRGDTRKTWTSVNEPSKPLRDPREIAREIARQVRENVTKDMKANLKQGTTSETGLGRKMELSEIVDCDIGGVNASEKSSGMVLGRDQASEFMSSLSSQGLDRKASHGVKEETKRSLDQIFIKKCDVVSTGPQSALRSQYYHGDFGRHPYTHGGLRVHDVDRIFSSQNHSVAETDVDCDTDSCAHSVYESEAYAYGRSENASCITLLRSRSVPTSCSSFQGAEQAHQGVVRNGIFVVGDAEVVDVNRSCDAAIHRSGPGPFGRSLSSRKRSGAKNSLFKSKPHVKELEEAFILSQELSTQKLHQDTCSEHEKVQHQIDDIGPILDSDSSVSSLDNFLTLEAALMAEDMDGAELPASATSPPSGNSMPRKPKILNPAESPNKMISLIDVESTGADCEASKDPPEQPSPVSVLDAPFQEEPESAMDFTEISSGLQELRVRLQLLKVVDQEAVSIQEEYQEEDCELTDDSRSANNHLHSVDCAAHHVDYFSLLVDGILCPKGREPELIYVKNLLVASGFTIDSATILTRWHSPTQPLAACAFERVENSYSSSASNNAASNEDGLDTQTRHLLFDSVNEVLLEVLGPHVNCRTWWKCPQKSSTMPCGKDLLGQVWSGVCKLLCSHSEVQDTLGSLVAEDLAKKDRWQDFAIDVEIVILGVEKAIWNDLVEETLSSYSLV